MTRSIHLRRLGRALGLGLVVAAAVGSWSSEALAQPGGSQSGGAAGHAVAGASGFLHSSASSELGEALRAGSAIEPSSLRLLCPSRRPRSPLLWQTPPSPRDLPR